MKPILLTVAVCACLALHPSAGERTYTEWSPAVDLGPVVDSPTVANDPPQYSPWSAPLSVGSAVNSAAQEGGPYISRDELSLYFNSNRPGGYGGSDLYVTHRASKDAPWEPPMNLGSSINTSANENAGSLSSDEHLLFFHSNRPGGFGGGDLYVARRHNKRDDSAWQPATNLGPQINTAHNEVYVSYHEDDATGAVMLYFNSNRPGGQGSLDIYTSTLQYDETWSTPELVPELNSLYINAQPIVSRNGLELYQSSNRPGSLGMFDIWVSTRASTTDPWGTPVNLGPDVNYAGANQGRAVPSADGFSLYHYSSRPGSLGDLDLWVSTRTKLKV